MARYINSDELAEKYRAKAIDLTKQAVLITDFRNTAQETDLTVPPNCGGFGRVRHFVRTREANWPANPLPIDPACRALRLSPQNMIRAQVFQNAVCNWRCWYCFVPFSLLDANRNHSQMMSVSTLIDLWAAERERPQIIDLTGGQPEIVPEWILWTMRELEKRKLDDQVYLWSDDNLSTDYFWTCLKAEQREYLSSYRSYGRVCCFKGFDENSFSFNTQASPAEFENQFARFKRLLGLGLDLYCYVTFTTNDTVALTAKMRRFVDRLQALDEHLPLRTVPLKIDLFGPTEQRLTTLRLSSITHQFAVVDAWNNELGRRYSNSLRNMHISDIPLRGREKIERSGF